MGDAETKPERVEKNEIVQPREGTDSARVWEVATELSEKHGRPAHRSEVKAHPRLKTVNEATLATQYARWVKFHGVSATIKEHREREATERRNKSTEAIESAKAEKREALEKKKQETEANRAEKKARAEKEREEKKAAREKEQQEKNAAREAEKAAASRAQEPAPEAKKPPRAKKAAA